MAYIIGDLETTGLSPADSIILEFAYVIQPTLLDFTDVTDVRSFLIRHSPGSLASHYEWAAPIVQKMHTESGLWAALANPDLYKTPLTELDVKLAEELEHYEGPHYFVGNSIRLDRAFIEAYMPRFSSKLHYRQIDLTSTELQLQAKGKTSDVPKTGGHRAAGDLLISIEQLNVQMAML